MAALGAQFAWNEISLVLFTALTPSGVVAAMIMLLWISLRALSDDDRHRIERKLYIPLLISMVGLVASASHLGTPSNALYVLAGLGRSPLSNEVVSGVTFLALFGLYWYYSFSDRRRPVLKRIWRALLILSGVVFVTFIAFAYSAETIVAWNTPLVPAALWLNALVGGPVLALFGLGRSQVVRSGQWKVACGLLAVSAVATVANVLVYVAQSASFDFLGNYTATVTDLVPFYGFAVGAFAVLAILGIVLCGIPLLRCHAFKTIPCAAGCLLVFAGIILMRFLFYMMHLTYGVGI